MSAADSSRSGRDAGETDLAACGARVAATLRTRFFRFAGKLLALGERRAAADDGHKPDGVFFRIQNAGDDLVEVLTHASRLQR